MNRYRFRANEEDYRPVIWPPVAPYWCTGYGDDYSIVVAYADNEGQIFKQWPEAHDITCQENHEIIFTDRFPRPDWWRENGK